MLTLVSRFLCVDQQAYQGEDHVCQRDHEGAQQADKKVGANHQVTYSVIFNHLTVINTSATIV